MSVERGCWGIFMPWLSADGPLDLKLLTWKSSIGFWSSCWKRYRFNCSLGLIYLCCFIKSFGTSWKGEFLQQLRLRVLEEIIFDLITQQRGSYIYMHCSLKVLPRANLQITGHATRLCKTFCFVKDLSLTQVQYDS